MARTLLVAQPGQPQLLLSGNGECALALAGSGLRVYRTATNETAYFAGPFASCAGGSSLVLQQNGALLLVDAAGNAVWSTDSGCTRPGATGTCYSAQVRRRRWRCRWRWRPWWRLLAPGCAGPSSAAACATRACMHADATPLLPPPLLRPRSCATTAC